MSVSNVTSFQAFRILMESEGVPELAIRNFAYYYQQLQAGQQGFIHEEEIQPVQELPRMEDLPDSLESLGKQALPHTLFLKLNGGLGTSMGLEKAKSLLRVKEGKSFLDIIAQHALRSGTPLALMNSFRTREDTLNALKAYPALQSELPLDFLQHKAPKVRRSDLQPVTWEKEPSLCWYPPGHGDIFIALVTSGMLEKLLDAGVRYAFISNSDNLGASIHPGILGYLIKNEMPFLMEVTQRTEVDKKGGHLALDKEGKLLLREKAQCPEEDAPHFEDILKHQFFNTNNLWLDFAALKRLLEERDGIVGLPLIRNQKTVDARDAQSTPVYQLETAMGSALEIFDGAGALSVPRSRFLPVKTTDHLLAIRSDLYQIDTKSRVNLRSDRELPLPDISLDSKYYGFFDQLEHLIPSPLSLLRCESLQISGPFSFGQGVEVVGHVQLVNPSDSPIHISDGTVLREDIK